MNLAFFDKNPVLTQQLVFVVANGLYSYSTALTVLLAHSVQSTKEGTGLIKTKFFVYVLYTLQHRDVYQIAGTSTHAVFVLSLSTSSSSHCCMTSPRIVYPEQPIQTSKRKVANFIQGVGIWRTTGSLLPAYLALAQLTLR